MGLNRREEGPFYNNGEGHGRPVSEMPPSTETSLQQTLRLLHMQHDGEAVNNLHLSGAPYRKQIEQTIHPDDSTRAYHRDQNPHGRNPSKKERR